MYFSVNLSLNFFKNFSRSFYERDESGGKRVAGGKKLAGSFWRDRDLFLGGNVFLAGRWIDPDLRCSIPVCPLFFIL